MITDVDLARYRWEWENGTRERAIALAREYIAKAPEAYAKMFSHLSVDDLVRMIDTYRANGADNDVVVLDMWIQAGYPGRRIIEGFAVKPEVEPAIALKAADVTAAEYEHKMRVGPRDEATEIAKSFVNYHREVLQHLLGSYTQEDCVALVDRYRVENDRLNRLIVEMWVASEYPPQQITGALDKNVRNFLGR